MNTKLRMRVNILNNCNILKINIRKPSLSIRVRKTLMALLVIMRRYALHIDALKPDNKVQDMPRVTMNENKFETLLDPTEVEEDKK